MSSPRVLIYGGKGALGSTCVTLFKSNNWWVSNLDRKANEEADSNIVVVGSDSWKEQEQQVSEAVESSLGNNKFDAIICVAGGWAGGNSSSKDYINNCDLVWKQSVWTSSIASSIAAKHLKEGGLLVLTGALAALDATPGMIGYGMAKACVHQMVMSLAAEGSGLPVNACVSAILPVTLDTPMNRKFMPEGDFASWTPLTTLSQELLKWTSEPQRPKSGSLVKVVTKDSKTDFTVV